MVSQGLPRWSSTRWKAAYWLLRTRSRRLSVITVDVGVPGLVETRMPPYSPKMIHGWGLPRLPSSMTMRWSSCCSRGRRISCCSTWSRRVLTAVSWVCLRMALRACW